MILQASERHCAACREVFGDLWDKNDGIWSGALFLAVHFDLPQTVDHLLERGVNADSKVLQRTDGKSRMPLVEAARLGLIAEIKKLLAHGAGIDTGDEVYGTPLMAACYTYRKEAIRLLLDNGANPNAVMSNGRTALYCAVEVGEKDWYSTEDPESDKMMEEIMKSLIEAGADILHSQDSENNIEKTPSQYRGSLIEFAVRISGNVAKLKVLFENYARGVQALRSGLVAAAESDSRVHMIGFLLGSGVDIESRAMVIRSDRNKDRCTALEFACEEKNVTTVTFLLFYGADPNNRSATDASAFERLINERGTMLKCFWQANRGTCRRRSAKLGIR